MGIDTLRQLEHEQATNMLTFGCSNVECMVKIRVGRVIRQPNLRVGALTFCPLCGSSGLATKDTEEDVWEALARAHNLPVEAIQAIYGIWNPREHTKFFDFVQELKNEVGLDDTKSPS